MLGFRVELYHHRNEGSKILYHEHILYSALEEFTQFGNCGRHHTHRLGVRPSMSPSSFYILLCCFRESAGILRWALGKDTEAPTNNILLPRDVYISVVQAQILITPNFPAALYRDRSVAS